MKSVAKYPGLMRRGTKWYLRVKVPKELVPELGRKEIWRSLDSGNHRQAVGRYHQVRGEVEVLLEAARRRRRGGDGEVTDAELRRLVTLWFQGVDPRAADVDRGMFEGKRQEALDNLDVDEAVLVSGDEDDWGPAVCRVADELLVSAGITLERAGDRYWVLCGYVRRALVEQVRRSRNRLKGGPAGCTFDELFTAPTPLPTTEVPQDLTLAALVEEYMAEPQQQEVTEKTRRGRRAMLGVLEELLGSDLPIGSVTRQDARRVRDTLLALPPNASKRWPDLGPTEAARRAGEEGLTPMSVTMSNAYLGCFISLFSHAVREHGLPTNPFEGLRVRASKTGAVRKRRPFTEEELHLLVKNPPPGSLALVMLVSLFNGLRLAEVLGLRPVDVREVASVLCLDVKEYQGHSLKSRSSERLVPAHPAIAPLLKQHMAKGVDPWSDLPERNRASVASKRLNRHLRHLGMSDPGLVFHSCRHSFRDALREAGVSAEIARKLGGWTSGAVEAQYGSGASPRALLRELRKVSYPVELALMWSPSARR